MSDFHESLERSHLQLLLALRDAATLAQAAEQLMVSPSAASHRLREAERRIGVRLVEPDGRTIALTAAGRQLAAAAALTEPSLRSAEAAARWLATGGLPTVRLALGFYDCAPWFRRFGADESMGFRVDVVRVRYGEDRAGVERRSADVAIELRAVITGEPLSAGELLIADDELVAIVSSDHPAIRRGSVTPGDIEGSTYLTAGRSPSTGFEHSEFIAPNRAYPRTITQVESVSLILDLVGAGRGVSIQPRLAIAEAAGARSLPILPLQDTTIGVQWVAVTSRNSDRAEAADRLAAAIVAEFAPPPGRQRPGPLPVRPDRGSGPDR